MDRFEELVEELVKHMECTSQNWFFGAGISAKANIPLMNCLTRRVVALLPNAELKTLYSDISNDLADDYHIEHVLSQLGDYIAIAERSKHGKAIINGNGYHIDELNLLHTEITKAIGETIKYGYCEEDSKTTTPENIGDISCPIISIDGHLDFVTTLISSRSNLLSRSSLTVFTTNYDTLLEDAFSLLNIEVNDGFIGSAIGHWNPKQSFNKATGINIVKLHGSVDWTKDLKYGLFRNRYGVNYLSKDHEVMIYPQATKYVETQKDPFAELFAELRRKLNSTKENILIINGYSFGDEHINSEIVQAINNENNKTTLIVFIDCIKPPLLSLLNNQNTSKKVFISTKEGIYHADVNINKKDDKAELEWWTFEGMIRFLKDGEAI